MKIIWGVLILGLGSAAFAEQDESLEVRTVVQKEEVVVADDGSTERRLVPAETVIPGEQVFYTITFRNVGAEPVENVVITNPIAAELRYVDGSAFGPGTEVQFSVDGGRTFAAAADLTVTEDGESRPATAEDFTHIRWKLSSDLATGSQGTARFAAVLN
ncbi:MAG: hypothetical protein R3176_02600 [Woeseiaceae bacterium]|nr:hypothetical protein [Woeseiaceae bacterium]